MRRALLASVLLSLLPTVLLAATAAAGFPADAIWTSKTIAAAGDSVAISTLVYNSGTVELKGVVAFDLDGSTLGSQQFDLSPGGSEVLSIPWTAVQGTHQASAAIVSASNVNGGDMQMSNSKTGSITISVGAAPPPPPPSALQQSVNSVSNVIASTTPLLSQAAQTVYNAGEGLRNAAVGYFSDQRATSRPHTGSVLGAETERQPAAAPGVLARIWTWLMQLGYTISTSPFFFYPVLIVACFVVLWLMSFLFGALFRRGRDRRIE